jgi:hypothetical protein
MYGLYIILCIIFNGREILGEPVNVATYLNSVPDVNIFVLSYTTFHDHFQDATGPAVGHTLRRKWKNVH